MVAVTDPDHFAWGDDATALRPPPAGEGPVRSTGAPPGSMASGRVLLTAAMRMLGHGSLIVRCVAERRYGRAALLGGASLAADAVVCRRLSDPAYLPGWAETVIDAIDAAAWVWLGPQSPNTLNQALFSTTVASGIQAGFRAAAGTDAVPVYDPTKPWPPPTPAAWVTRLAGAALPVVAPWATAVATERRRTRRAGDRWAITALASGTAAVTLAALGARHRARLHSSTRRLWLERTRIQISRERETARANLATSSTPGHDFKKTLFALGLYGSDEALHAARAQGARPAETLAGQPGKTLREVVGSLAITPLDAQRLWIVDEDEARIRTFLDEATTGAADGATQVIDVKRPSPYELELGYLGTRLVLRNEPPPLLARFYPTAPALVISAFWKASALLPEWRGLPAPVALTGAATDLALGLRHWQRPPTDSELRTIHAVAFANALVGLALSATRLSPERTATGNPALAGNPYLMGLSMLTVSHWSRLDQPQRRALGLAYAAWFVTGQLRRPVPALHVTAELLTILTAFVPAWDLVGRLEGEVALLQGELQADFRHRCDIARAAALTEEFDEFRRQLDIARRALHDLADSLDDETARQLTAECDELERWLDRDQTEQHANS